MMGSSSDYRLIELIRQNKHLFDQRDPDFRNLEKKEITWQAIAAAQGSTPEICRRRFRSLRDRFARERRQRKKELLDGTNPNPIWQKMLFLSPHLRTRKRFNWSRPHKRSESDEQESSDMEEDDSPEQRSADVAEQNVGRSSRNQVKEESVAEAATRSQEASANQESSTARRMMRYRPIKPKPDSSSHRNNPIIVNLVPKETRNQDGRGMSDEVEIGGCGEVQETGAESRDDRDRPSASHSGRQDADDGSGSNSHISCNAAFCLMLRDSLDQVTSPLKLSVLRIKILTMLHNEVYS